MTRRMYLIGMACIVGILIAMGCGSQSPKAPHQTKDGRLFVWNDCTSLVTIKVIKVNDESTVLVEGVVVAPGERKEVVETVLEGGTKLKVNVRGKAERSNDVTERDLPVEIDGITTLHITGIQPGAVIHEVIYG